MARTSLIAAGSADARPEAAEVRIAGDLFTSGFLM